MSQHRAVHTAWSLLPTLELGLAAAAAGLWYTQGGAIWYTGPWPGPLPLLFLLALWGIRLLWLRRAPPHPARSRPVVLTLPLVLFLATAAVALLLAYDPGRAWAKAWLLVGALGIYWALSHQPDLSRLYLALAAWSGFATLLTLYLFLTTDWAAFTAKIPALTRLAAAISSHLPDLTAHGIHPNVAGGLLATLLPLTLPLVALLRRTSHPALKPRVRFLLGMIGLLGLSAGALGVLVTVSRGAWLALLATGALWALWRALARFGWQRRLLFLALILACAAAVAGLTGWQLLYGHIPGASASALADALHNRLRILRLGLLLTRDTPFTGVGLGMYEIPFSIYTLLIHVGYLTHSHNLFLDLAIEQGLPGLLTFLALTGTTGLIGLRLLREHARPVAGPGDTAPDDQLLIAQSALASLAVLLIHGLADDALYGSRGLLLFFVPHGVLASLVGLPTTRVDRQRMAHEVRKFFFSGLVCSILLTATVLCGRIIFGEGLSWYPARLVSLWHANLGSMKQMRMELTLYDPLHFDNPTIDQVRRMVDLTSAEAHFRRALAWDRQQPTARQRLTEIALARGAYADALAHMQVLWDAGYRDRVTRLLYGDTLVATGHIDEAVSIIRGLEFARARLLGQAWARYHVGGDTQREIWARTAAAQLDGP